MPPRTSSTLAEPRLAPQEETDEIEWTDHKASAKARKAAEARQASSRRRGIDPTTCDRDYSEAELEFMKAMESYKRSSGRMFPTWCEVLEVIRSIGYEKATENSAV